MVLTLLKANIHLLDGKDCMAIYVINHQIISNDAESQSLEQLSWLYLRNHPDDVLVAPAWNFSFHQHSRRILNTTRRQFKTGSINLWVCSLKQLGKVYSRTSCFSLSALGSYLCPPCRASWHKAFPKSLENSSEEFSASPVLLLPFDFPGMHTLTPQSFTQSSQSL